MSVARLKTCKPARIVSVFLALSALWLCSGGALKHTDDLSAYSSQIFSTLHQHQSLHSAVAPGNDDCAACRWVQTGRDVSHDALVSIAAVVVYAPPTLPLPSGLRTRDLLRASLRAPPLSE